MDFKIPINDAIITALARMIDDSQTESRKPSHSEIEYQFKRVGLEKYDPNLNGAPVGKAKRVRGVLSWAIENDQAKGSLLIKHLISLIRGSGGFRNDSENYLGFHSICDLQNVLKTEGCELTLNGEIRPITLENLSGVEMTEALQSYVRRAKKGYSDAALIAGISKDLLEATAAHIVQEVWGAYKYKNFPTLLGQAFVALNLATTQDKPDESEPIVKKIERNMFELACSINRLRNKEGTGHGRPWLPTVSQTEAIMAIEFMGIIAEYMLNALNKR